ncbi:hypothetical protein PU560_15250 [Georgenia sp. 10Sc9-8]|uniref:CBU-0592-like domain-containing protein n=1 Tax=Georgenia halotolerans TaxID=3028317 RepID=A0ABT5U0J8_9MICO|nr:hypothetical protein [Georgenia halotolerans]
MSTLLPLLVSVAGWIGAAATLGAYLLVSQRRVEPDSIKFQGMNMLGAALLGVSATVSGAWPSATLNYIWILIGVQAVISARHVVRMGLARVLRRMRAKARRQRQRIQQVSLLPRRRAAGSPPVSVEEISAAVTGTSLPRVVDEVYAAG